MQHWLSCAATRSFTIVWSAEIKLPTYPPFSSHAYMIEHWPYGNKVPTYFTLPRPSLHVILRLWALNSGGRSPPISASDLIQQVDGGTVLGQDQIAFRISHGTESTNPNHTNHTIKLQLSGPRKGCPLDRLSTPRKHVGRIRDIHHLGCRALVTNLFSRQPLGRQQLHLRCLYRGEERRGRRKGWRLSCAQPPLQA